MKLTRILLAAGMAFTFTACSESGPAEINLGKDQCDNCKMTITEKPYAAELLTSKGRAYKFDDVSCLTMYESANADKADGATQYLVDFPSGEFVEKSQATLITGGSIKSPMGGNTQAYKDAAQAEKAAAELGATLTK